MGKVLTTQEEVTEFVAQQRMHRYEELVTEFENISLELQVIIERQNDILKEVVAAKTEEEIEALETEMEAHFKAADERVKRIREIEREIEKL